jgi:hypothetical protein
MPAIPAAASVRKQIATACAQPKRGTQFAIRQHSCSGVITAPWNGSFTQRAKSSLSALPDALPVGSAMTALARF